MRPLPVVPIAGLPEFVSGLAVVRGVPTPVVDATSLLAGERGQPTRYVTLTIGDRRIALAVEGVDGLVEIQPDLMATLPPLLQGAGVISAVGAIDASLLVILQGAHIIPDDVWARIDAGEKGQ